MRSTRRTLLSRPVPLPALGVAALGLFALGALAVGCAPADTADEGDAADADSPDAYPDAVAADPAHYTVEFENEVVRLLRIVYGPGESSVMHRHPANCAVGLSDATWQMTEPDGTVSEDNTTMGGVGCTEEAGAHQPRNAGEEPAELVLVEFKPGATAGSDELPEHPDAVTADPDHYTVEYENDVARLIRIRYGPGETSAMHRHPAGCAIFLSDQPTRMELPSGEVEEHEPVETGHVRCDDAGAHLPTNAGEEGLELVLLELKGRATL